MGSGLCPLWDLPQQGQHLVGSPTDSLLSARASWEKSTTRDNVSERMQTLLFTVECLSLERKEKKNLFRFPHFPSSRVLLKTKKKKKKC